MKQELSKTQDKSAVVLFLKKFTSGGKRDKTKTQITRIQGRSWLDALKSKIVQIEIPLVEGDKNPTQTSLSITVTDWFSESKNEPEGLGLETSCY